MTHDLPDPRPGAHQMNARKMWQASRKQWRLAVCAVLALVLVAGAVGSARSALPGTNGRIAFTSDRSGSTELWTIDPGSGAMTQLTTFGPNTNPVESPAWSPGGDEIAFSQGGYIFAYDVADQTVRSVTDINSSRFDSEPAWSPDGTMLALTSTDGIWRVSSDGSGLVKLTDRADRDPAWSPDGGTIAFTRSGGVADEGDTLHDEDIYLMNRDGGGLVRLTTELAATDPTWSPDGSKIAYVLRESEQTDILVRDVDDPDAGLAVVTSSPEFESRPAWSPDGTKIVYQKRQVGGQDSVLAAANADGSGGEQQLTNGAADRFPDWGRVTVGNPPDTDPTCSLASRRVRVDEGNPGQPSRASFQVDCENPTADTYSIDYATAPGTARQPDDYAPASDSFLVPPGESDRQIHVDVVGDSVREPHETFTLTLAPSGFSIPVPTATAAIVDDDGFGVVVEAPESVPEGDSGSTEVEFDVSLNQAADQPVSVVLARGNVSGSTPMASFADADLAVATSLTFDPGEVQKTLTFQVFGDTVLEDDEAIDILPFSRQIRDANAQGDRLMILDDDAATLSIGDATVTEGDSGTATAEFTVTRSDVGGAAEVDFATEDVNATAGDDYVARSGHLLFAAGSPTATVEVEVRGDTLDEPDETFRVRLSNPTNATIVDGTGVGTIEDNDPEPSLSIDDTSVLEGDVGATTARFNVRLSAPSARAVTVDYASVVGTATAPDDFTAIAPTELTFIPGGPTTHPVDVAVRGDVFGEGDETFTIVLADAENASIADGTATGTIVDDDPLVPQTCDGKVATIVGGPGRSVLIGTSGDDVIVDLGGNNNVIGGRGGADTICSGPGSDEISGGEGDDTIKAGAGRDELTGGGGDDSLDSGDDNDTIFGDGGDDTITSGSGDDRFQGGDGDDTISDNTGANRGGGDAGADTITTGARPDQLDGGAGDDTINAGDGDNTITGADGDDTITTGAGRDGVDGGAGIDLCTPGPGQDFIRNCETATDNQAPSGQTCDGKVATIVGGPGRSVLIGTSGDDVIVDLGGNNNVIGGRGGADTICSGPGSDEISGGEGDDTIKAGAGRDELTGGGGDDSLDSGDDNDTIFGDGGDDTITSGSGDDRFQGGDGDDTISDNTGANRGGGDAGADTITTGARPDQLDGGAGDDTINAGDGDNTITGADGDDTITTGAGRDGVDGGAGIDLCTPGPGQDFIRNCETATDNQAPSGQTCDGKVATIVGGPGRSVLIGTSGDDVIVDLGGNNNVIGGRGGADTICSGPGSDEISGGEGDDTIKAGAGRDELTGGGGDDSLDSGDDNDTIFGDGGDDTITSGSGDDRFQGGDGDDTISDNTGANRGGGDAGADTITTGARPDQLDGGAGDDTINAGDGDNTITGADGDDTITTGAGRDGVDGGAGIDLCTPGPGQDFIRNCETAT